MPAVNILYYITYDTFSSQRTVNYNVADEHEFLAFASPTIFNYNIGPSDPVNAIFPTDEDAANYYFSTAATAIINYMNSIGAARTYTAGNLIYFMQDAYDKRFNTKFDKPTGTTSQYVRGDGTLATLPVSGRTTSALSMSLVGTGATGTQISSTRDSTIRATFNTQTTSTLAGNNSSVVVVKTCATNSATESDWIEQGRTSTSQPSGISVVIGQVIAQAGQVCVDVPAGYYVKAVNSGTGTHSESFVSGQKTIY